MAGKGCSGGPRNLSSLRRRQSSFGRDAARKNVRPWLVSVREAAHARLKGQQPCVLCLTGLSGAGKSTIANAPAPRLQQLRRHNQLLDGNITDALNKNLGFSPSDQAKIVHGGGGGGEAEVHAGFIVIPR